MPIRFFLHLQCFNYFVSDAISEASGRCTSVVMRAVDFSIVDSHKTAIKNYPVPEHEFHIIPPVISLLIPCYDFSRRKPLSRVVTRRWMQSSPLKQSKFPAKFPLTGILAQRRVRGRLRPPTDGLTSGNCSLIHHEFAASRLIDHTGLKRARKHAYWPNFHSFLCRQIASPLFETHMIGKSFLSREQLQKNSAGAHTQRLDCDREFLWY